MTRVALDRTRLTAVLGMCGSDALGERAAAAAMASKMVRDAGLDWHDVLQPPTGATPRARASEPRTRGGGGQVDARYAALTTCNRLQAHLTVWEQSFLVGISGRRFLSDKQLETLVRIAAELPQRAAR